MAHQLYGSISAKLGCDTTFLAFFHNNLKKKKDVFWGCSEVELISIVMFLLLFHQILNLTHFQPEANLKSNITNVTTVNEEVKSH